MDARGAQCRKNIWPSLFTFAKRVSGVFYMKINQENLDYFETNFIKKSSQCDLKYPALMTVNTFFISKRV